MVERRGWVGVLSRLLRFFTLSDAEKNGQGAKSSDLSDYKGGCGDLLRKTPVRSSTTASERRRGLGGKRSELRGPSHEGILVKFGDVVLLHNPGCDMTGNNQCNSRI